MFGLLVKITPSQIASIEKNKCIKLPHGVADKVRTIRKTSPGDIAVLGIREMGKQRLVLLSSMLASLPLGQENANLKYVKAFKGTDQWKLPQGYAQSQSFVSDSHELLDTEADVLACLVRSPAALLSMTSPKLPPGFQWKSSAASHLLVTFENDNQPTLYSRHTYDGEVLGSFHKYMEALGDVWKKMDGQFFQAVMQELFECLGFSVEHHGLGKDGGVDLTLTRHDGFIGRDLYVVQCKKFQASHKVGPDVVRALRGVAPSRCAQRGIVITTSSFTADARKDAADERGVAIQLIDGRDLGKLALSRIQQLPTLQRLL